GELAAQEGFRQGRLDQALDGTAQGARAEAGIAVGTREYVLDHVLAELQEDPPILAEAIRQSRQVVPGDGAQLLLSQGREEEALVDPVPEFRRDLAPGDLQRAVGRGLGFAAAEAHRRAGAGEGFGAEVRGEDDDALREVDRAP